MLKVLIVFIYSGLDSSEASEAEQDTAQLSTPEKLQINDKRRRKAKKKRDRKRRDKAKVIASHQDNYKRAPRLFEELEKLNYEDILPHRVELDKAEAQIRAREMFNN